MTQTIMFTDVEGSSKLRRARGERAAQFALRSHGSLMRSVLQDHRGREVQSFGDGFLFAFSSARDAVTCAIAIQRAIAEDTHGSAGQTPQARIGINVGEVIEEDGDIFGLPVDAAEHIQSKAKAGQILVSELVRGVVGMAHDIQFVERGRFKLKNFPERCRLYEVPWHTERAETKPIARALLHADIVGAVSVYDRLGDRKSLEAMKDFHAILRAAAASHAADWTKTAGDNYIASFRSADAAVLAAAEMQQGFAAHNAEHRGKPLRVRIALHYGEVLREADELFGNAMFVVVLLSATGRPAGILATSDLRERVSEAQASRFGRPRLVKFADLSGSYLVHRLAWK
jgi:class 3 adenylate cyclase